MNKINTAKNIIANLTIYNFTQLSLTKNVPPSKAAVGHEHLIDAVGGFNRVDPKFMEVGD
jgi:hypothetical protein